MKFIIRNTTPENFAEILEIINDAAMAYRGIIPPDRWQEPYMPAEELQKQIAEGVEFSGYFEDGRLLGVMGIQDKGEVNLIRHAYVRTQHRKHGIGGKLLRYLHDNSGKPMLIGTWKAAEWAVNFYRKHGFALLENEEKKNALLRQYWNIPDRQVETSVVLADAAGLKRFGLAEKTEKKQ